ncbi:tRNA (cytidine(34)-2'-O)-methyltransferase [Convivina praedatoris]|uniref:Putative tRNA (cytidine(34)-2'-O)-methyltransferase n=1 Tax=Convivina praedatoris TaxID=2880963 RepID=A0ABN8HDW5_9LACO|nr:tRNA (cytidine(34)-2'-O)-methyltransferase [Convivina sp. LMG 32447]CAH1850037.1 tRNA (cytidine(34)-2'-O)-methyltransferase [Convivina sp. LMG 32447]CAH1850048.1 tRNA (cytidine(34)-2'-O)-methyltransferase [Convivina sp. LMG 32447]CAH1851169.1 tRNA (cytidine(34)-2'-O)-methyltransferase [Convivina sp. LMG 32447]
MTNHIVLFEPLMPANTGNIARTTAGTDAVLHLIEPLGFELDDKHVKRAGLDYWEHVQLVRHANLPEFLATLKADDQLFLVSKFANRDYSQADYQQGGDCYFLFGKETTGLPEVFMRQNPDKAIRIPQDDQHVRSLNLSNTVAIVLYEALRQQGFPGLESSHHYEQDKLK